jgi:hypothetical protein
MDGIVINFGFTDSYVNPICALEFGKTRVKQFIVANLLHAREMIWGNGKNLFPLQFPVKLQNIVLGVSVVN